MDYADNDYIVEMKQNSGDNSPRLSDEHNWDAEDGYHMLDRWQDRAYTTHY